VTIDTRDNEFHEDRVVIAEYRDDLGVTIDGV
jgi:hypothetical protein